MTSLTELFTTPFMLSALAGGLMVAITAGMLGCFVVWRQMAYFGDALSHSALLGIAFGLMIGLKTDIGILLIALVFSLFLAYLLEKKWLGLDSLLGILAHAGLAFGVIWIHLSGKPPIDLHRYLFGDILTIQLHDLGLMLAGAIVIITLLMKNWDALILMTLHEDLARAEQINRFKNNLLVMSLMSIVVALAIHIVGVLLLTSLLIIPAASAQFLARSPKHMALLSSLFGCVAVFLGLIASLLLDTPAGPSIVAISATLFALLSCKVYLKF